MRFGTDTRDGLARAGYENVEPILQGSAVTGKSFKTGEAFDVGRGEKGDRFIFLDQLPWKINLSRMALT